MELLHLECACLKVLSDEYEERQTDVAIGTVCRHFPEVAYIDVLKTLEKLESMQLVRLTGDQLAKRQRLLLILPTAEAHFYFEGRLKPLLPGQVEVILQLDRVAAAQLCEAVGATFPGQVELVEAVKSIAEELRKPPEASATDKIQAATSLLSFAADAFPMIKAVLLPIIMKLASGG